MHFEIGHIYHINNQGNNRQRIFFKRENYLFFLEKIKNHVLPYADILAYCLMPNHFHLMVYVNWVELDHIRSTAQSRTTDDRPAAQSRTTEKDRKGKQVVKNRDILFGQRGKN